MIFGFRFSNLDEFYDFVKAANIQLIQQRQAYVTYPGKKVNEIDHE